MGLSLFDISLEFIALKDLMEDEFNEETGELIDKNVQIKELFDNLKLSFEDKLDNSQRYILTLKGEQDILDKEIKRLQAKKTALKNKEDNLKRLMLNALSESGETNFKTSLYSFIIKESEAISIVNEEELERKYMRISYEPDKVKIKEAITTKFLVLRPNKPLIRINRKKKWQEKWRMGSKLIFKIYSKRGNYEIYKKWGRVFKFFFK